MEPKWLVWSRKLQALVQAGLTYSDNPFDLERYASIRTIAAEIAAEGSHMDAERLEALFAGDEGYTTPKVDVRGAVFRDGKILLVQEMLDGGRWTVPGGWVDPGDAPGGAAEREVWEETGYQVKAVKLAAVLDRERNGHPPYFHSIYKLFFICELIGGEPTESIETGQSAFFDPADLPELSIARITPEEVAMLYRHHLQPGLPTEFD